MNKKKMFALFIAVILATSNAFLSYASEPAYTATLTNTETGERIEVPVKVTTTVRPTTRSADGPQVEIVEQTVEVKIPDGSIQPRDSQTKEEDDSSVSCTATGKITYAKYYDSGWEETLYLLQAVEGNWNVHSVQISISDMKYVYGCNGFRPNVSGQARTVSTSSMSFNQNTGFTNYISSLNSGSICGMAMRCKVKRAGSSSTWDFEFQNNVINNGYIWGWD